MHRRTLSNQLLSAFQVKGWSRYKKLEHYRHSFDTKHGWPYKLWIEMPNSDDPPISTKFSNNKPSITSTDRTQQKTTAYDAGNPVLA